MGSVIDHDLVEDIVARGTVTADDVGDLRRTVYRDGVVDRRLEGDLPAATQIAYVQVPLIRGEELLAVRGYCARSVGLVFLR